MVRADGTQSIIFRNIAALWTEREIGSHGEQGFGETPNVVIGLACHPQCQTLCGLRTDAWEPTQFIDQRLQTEGIVHCTSSALGNA